MQDNDHPVDDSELMRSMQAGDERALAALYDRHAGQAYGLAMAILRHPQDAEDAVAQAFAQLWQGRDRFDSGQGTLGAWLNTIVRSRALDLYRARGRRARAHDAAADAPPPVWAPPGPEQQALRTQAGDVILAAVQALPADQRRPLALAYFQGLTHSEIAAELEVPLGTVKTRIRAAMQKLRERLGAGQEARSS